MNAPVRPPAWMPPSPLPSSFETPRLVVRFYEAGDAPALVAALDEDRESFLPWLPWVLTENRTTNEAIYTIEHFRRLREKLGATQFVLGFFDRADGSLVGGSGFHNVVPATLEGEIGYWTRPSRRQRGFCVEAVAALLDWGFLPQAQGGWGFRRLHVTAASSNVSSRRVVERLGLPLECERRADRWVDGLGWTDTCGWGITADAWAARAGAAQRAP